MPETLSCHEGGMALTKVVSLDERRQSINGANMNNNWQRRGDCRVLCSIVCIREAKAWGDKTGGYGF